MGLSADDGDASPKSDAKLLQNSRNISTDKCCADFALFNEALFSSFSMNGKKEHKQCPLDLSTPAKGVYAQETYSSAQLL